MLNKNAAERITLEVVQSHPYLSEDTRKIGRKSSNRKISLLPSSKDIEKHIKTVNAIFDLLTYLLKLVDLILLVSKKIIQKKEGYKQRAQVRFVHTRAVSLFPACSCSV